MMTTISPGFYLWVPTPKEEEMKVRCKGIWAGSEWTVLEESPNFYIAKCDTASGTASLPKADYEPVQKWVIVPIEKLAMDTRDYNGQLGNCNSYFFVDKYGNFITSDHEPIIIDGKVGLRRRKQ